MISRSAGLLLHPTSLPSRFGIGDLGSEAEAFLDWAAAAGQRIWQVLPLGPPGFDNSPYDTQSSFAGDPLLISPERLREEGLLDASALKHPPAFPAERIAFGAVIEWKQKLLRLSWERFRLHAPSGIRQELSSFVEGPQQAGWLADWALYAALRRRFGEREWTSWDRPLRRRETAVLDAVRLEMAEEIAYHEYLQFLFFRQWDRLKEAAHRRGVGIMGDLPIYTALDSADVWANARLFQLAEEGRPEWVGGVPPDYFSPTGQLWGNPTYRWDRMEQEGYDWWIERVRANLRLADLVRLDHFRGFVDYWEVPASEQTAANGRWIPGPREKLFTAIRSALGDLPVVAEDLGFITPEVTRLREALGFPGMKVLQFAFGEPDSDHLPHHHVPESVVYTGTHDNDTTRGWFSALRPEEKKHVLQYLRAEEADIEWGMIRAAYESPAGLAIVPMQDVFGLGSEARMNTPGKSGGNWSWRSRREQFTPELAGRLRQLAERTGRF